MSFYAQQEAAIKKARAWRADPHAPKVFRIFGYAGTGKTHIAKKLAADDRGAVLFAAYTGKAALQLRKKGCDASTIHSLIYAAEVDEQTGTTCFKLNRDSALKDASLLIVDEVSMVGDDVARDLLSFGVKLLVLGDPAQLPPVNGEGFFINAEPDVLLTEIVRQGRDNPIIRLSMDVRERRPLEHGWHGASRVVTRGDISEDELRKAVLKADQVIVGRNQTRQTFNRRIRSLHGLAGHRETWHPVVGDKLICLRNNKEKGTFNGSLWRAQRSADKFGCFDLNIRSMDEPNSNPLGISVPDQFFCGREGQLDRRARRKMDAFTFGWAITCHKSQGSEWDDVVVFDESATFGDARTNWLYTAITRAAERVLVVTQ